MAGHQVVLLDATRDLEAAGGLYASEVFVKTEISRLIRCSRTQFAWRGSWIEMAERGEDYGACKLLKTHRLEVLWQQQSESLSSPIQSQFFWLVQRTRRLRSKFGKHTFILGKICVYLAQKLRTSQLPLREIKKSTNVVQVGIKLSSAQFRSISHKLSNKSHTPA
jgi:hypothetical protein